VARNPDYWKQGRPYLDGIDYTIIKNPSTGVLAFVAGKFDMTSPYFLQVPLLKDAQNQAPQAICKLVPSNVNRNVMMNREAPPFDHAELRRAVALTLDRKAFIDTLTEGKGDLGGAMLPLPEGVWGMPADMLKALRGYDPDVAKNRADARSIMEGMGYGPDKRLKVTVSTRNVPPFRDPAVILIDQLKEIYIDADLDPIDTVQWFPKVMRGDYKLALNLTGNGLDDPDQTLYENFTCGAEGNYDRYCNPGLDKMVRSRRADAPGRGTRSSIHPLGVAPGRKRRSLRATANLPRSDADRWGGKPWLRPSSPTALQRHQSARENHRPIASSSSALHACCRSCVTRAWRLAATIPIER